MFIFLCILLSFKATYSDDIITFINESPTPYHVINLSQNVLVRAGFQQLDMNKPWKLQNKNYFVKKGFSSLIAFSIGQKYRTGNAFSIIVAHSDSPVIKLKPNYNRSSQGYLQFGVYTYGGGNWYTWFDRDLYLAGIIMTERNYKIAAKLCTLDKKFIIPTVAVHLDTKNKKGFIINLETTMNPIIGLSTEPLKTQNEPNYKDKSKELMKLIKESCLMSDNGDIIEMDLSLVPSQPATYGGLNDEFIFAPRLDNLFGAYTGLQGFLASLNDTESLEDETNIRIFAVFDNEEVGSMSATGANSNFIVSVLKRLARHGVKLDSNWTEDSDKNLDNGGENDAAFERAISRSFLISADQSHAVHPNYADKHEKNHETALDKGMVVKYDQNLNYATNAISGAIIKSIAKKYGIPLQPYIGRNDMGTGSTIGPMLSALLGIHTVDVGAPQLAMHSIRETCATISVQQAINLYKAFYQEYSHIDLQNIS